MTACTHGNLYSGARPGNQAIMVVHDLISHSVTLSWHWANQALHCPNNAEHLASKWQQVSILYKSLVWLDNCSNPWFLPHSRPVLHRFGHSALYAFPYDVHVYCGMCSIPTYIFLATFVVVTQKLIIGFELRLLHIIFSGRLSKARAPFMCLC